MAQTYLQLVNAILKRITQAELATLVGATGHAAIIKELLNEAQNELWAETTNWYTLFAQRTFLTTTVTASTIAFNNANPDTITDSGSGFGSFSAGQTIVVSGSSSNDGIYVIGTAAAGTLTLQTSDSLTAEAAAASVTVTAVTYPVASDWGRTLSLTDLTNDRVLVEDYSKSFDIADPDMQTNNDPVSFCMQGAFYRLFYAPSSSIKIVDRYWKVPTALSADSDTSILPLFCENFLIRWAWMSICSYLHQYDMADRLAAEIYGVPSIKHEGILGRAVIANKRVLDKMNVMSTSQPTAYGRPRLPAAYGSPNRYYR